MITTIMAITAQATAGKSRRSMATDSQEPIPGRATVWPRTVMASDATTKNQAPDMDIIMFQIRPGMEKGSSSRQKRFHGDRPYMLEASCRSSGRVRIDWYMLKVMFQAWAVKMAKMEAHSSPSSRFGNRPMKKVTVKVRKPSTGTDCRMSSAGTMISSALRLLAARGATTKVNRSEAARAANMRRVVRAA